ncbi:MAG: hypothetical protein QOI95_3280 [Acidimicrobiaceae bacterium]|jgi:hypothetical protein
MSANSGMLPFPCIIGSGRSGTTLLRSMLDSHPDVAVPGESNWLGRVVRIRRRLEAGGVLDVDGFTRVLANPAYEFRTRWQLEPLEARNAVEAASAGTVADAVRAVYAAYARGKGKLRYGEKMPGFARSVDALGAMLPELRFIHLVRDGRDVALSYLDVPFGPTTIGDGAIWWRKQVMAARAAGTRIGAARYLELRYEDLVDDPPQTLHRMCRFLELDYNEAMLDYTARADELLDTVRSEAHSGLRRPPTPGLRDWRSTLAPGEVALFEAIAGDALDEFGYPRVRPSVTPGVRLRAAGARSRYWFRRAQFAGRRVRGRARREWTRRSILRTQHDGQQ